jgi:glyceraldehyde-3-phosphate dehydrogenase (NADP+)
MALMVTEYPFFSHGEPRRSDEAFEVRAPYDGAVVGLTYRASERDLEAAMAATEKAFEQTRALPSHRRAEILHRVATTLTARQEEIARILALEAGKPIKAARTEVGRSIFTFTHAAEEATRIEGEWLPLDLTAASEGRWAIVRRFPLGPMAGITPFNFPLNLVAHKIGPAIASGNSMVLKPASQTPLTALTLAQIFHEAGLPAGGFNVLPCAPQVAEALATDERLKLLTFTGSPAVGWELKQKAGRKRVTLELGGNAGVIIHHDADLAYAAERCAFGGFTYAGQTCISVQRIFVHERIYDEFTERFLAFTRQLRVGDPLDELTDVGPMINLGEAERAARWVEEAVAGGAQLLCGGERDGALMLPTVLAATDPVMRVNCQEIFAPVVTLARYRDFDRAVEQVNHSHYGLQAGLFTSDLRAIFRAFERLDVGGVIVGDVPTYRADHLPYGGVKQSGQGREGIRYAIEEMTERKVMVLNLA